VPDPTIVFAGSAVLTKFRDQSEHEALAARCHARSGVDNLAFAGVDAAAHLEMQAFDAVADGPRRPDRGRGGAEPREESISDRLDLAAPVSA
jgi:hypothetical protein